jgi:predicted pyridoxine 5'-phosphate oxidase superfamily flavin-nucleotide-binding protein
MSNLYTDSHRVFQDECGTRALADHEEQAIFHTALDPGAQAFIGAQDMFFLATVDAAGQPSVSYKGGPAGFVRVVDESTLVFPCYDGNGMFLSMGNIAETAKVGMLFISFEKPMRFRVKGEASIVRGDPLQAEYPDAQFMVRVAVTGVWFNCPRYIHRYQRVATSRYVPEEGKQRPLAGWQRIDNIQHMLPPDVAERARAEGLHSEEEWLGQVMAGDPSA